MPESAARFSFLNDLPERTESSLRGAIHGVESGDPVVRQSVTSLEAPSAVAVVRLLAPGVEIEFLEIPLPDPRVPLGL